MNEGGKRKTKRCYQLQVPTEFHTVIQKWNRCPGFPLKAADSCLGKEKDTSILAESRRILFPKEKDSSEIKQFSRLPDMSTHK